MSDEPDYILEISSAAHSGSEEEASSHSPGRSSPGATAPASNSRGSSGTPSRNEARPWIGVHFECCGVYARIYRQPDSPVYAGQCPRCLAKVTARVGADGTPQRLFRAS